jgi:hypothetical protein
MTSPLILQLYSQNHWTADGSQTIWNFTFADGYINRDYVKAYTLDPLANKTDLIITDDMFIGDFQLSITPAVPANYRLVILRDTPKDAPLVNFGDGARQSEVSFDTIARQAVHIAAEVLDGAGLSLLTDEIGFKAMKQVPYVGSSIVSLADNGKSHYKEDGTGVTVPNTLPSTFLSTIINESLSSMNIAFDSGVAIMQGSDDTDGKSTWVLSPRQTLSIMKVKSGLWYISGKAV